MQATSKSVLIDSKQPSSILATHFKNGMQYSSLNLSSILFESFSLLLFLLLLYLFISLSSFSPSLPLTFRPLLDSNPLYDLPSPLTTPTCTTFTARDSSETSSQPQSPDGVVSQIV